MSTNNSAIISLKKLSFIACKLSFNFKKIVTNIFILLILIFMYSEAFSQATCLQSRWVYTPGIINNKLEWLERGFVAINGWGPGGLTDIPIFTIHSTKLPIGTNPTLNNIPSSLRFITESIISGERTDNFGKSFIDFWSVSIGDFNWKVADITTIELPEGKLYNIDSLESPLSAGLAFSCAGGPVLNNALTGTREVFRIINGNMGVGILNPLDKFEVKLGAGGAVGDKITFGVNNYNPSIRLYHRYGAACDPVVPNQELAFPWWIEINNDTEPWGDLFFKSGDEQCSNGTETVTTKVAFSRNGNVGIGVEHPTVKLEVIGDIKATSLNTSGNIVALGTVQIGTNNYTGTIESPSTLKLAVDGSIVAKEMIITLEHWADFVFNPDYQLMDINQVESFIKTNKHLPGLPNASSVEKNGIAVGNMQKILLQKIEELTLYMIELKKENEEIKKSINNKE